MRRVAFSTLGCKVNQFETEVVEGLFRERGYTTVDFSSIAEVYVINTCSVTHLGEKKSRQLIRRAVRTNAEAIVVVTGCYAQVSSQEIAAIEGVDIVIGTQERNRIVDVVEEFSNLHQKRNLVSDIMKADHFEDIPLLKAPERTRAFLKIQEGCDNFCSYCIIPYARGPLRSRSLSSVIHEAEKLLHAGFKEIVLTGIHLGAFGRDLDDHITLTDAVRNVLSFPNAFRLRLGSIESLEISPELIRIFQTDSRLCKHLHLPLQAGDDTILAAMNRQYTTAQYRQLVQRIEAEVPNMAISTDIIVGFPGETEAMHENALRFVESMNFSRMHIFPYSRRNGTAAASFPQQIPEVVKKQRLLSMQQLAERKSRDFAARFIGKRLEVLIETVTAEGAEGLTEQYLRVYIPNCQVEAGNTVTVMPDDFLYDGLRGVRVN
ncbi:MAG: modification enzyme, MiaB family [Firmicutes bacterium]|nr:modification enzyme, MiaB family [Bacillota bacterium]